MPSDVALTQTAAKLSPYRRFLSLGALFVLELLPITIWLDGANLHPSNPVTLWMQHWGAAVLRSIVASAVVFLAFSYLRARPALVEIGSKALDADISWKLMAVHVAALAVFCFLSKQLYGGGAQSDALGALWIGAGLAAILLASTAFVPYSQWRRLFRATGPVWAYALAAGSVAGCMGVVVRLLWGPAARITFGIVQVMVGPFVPGLTADPSRLRLGTPAFHVVIDPACSGLEGMGLVLIFGVVWLWLFRSDLRFPQAFLLIPAGLAAAFLLNSVRIAALILIGVAGAPGVALGGFHSQAGWIAFNAVALVLLLGAQRIPGISRKAVHLHAVAAAEPDATTAYLLPFLAILAAAMISRAASAGFEWLYPLRFFAAAAVLWWNRKHYRHLDWRVGWPAMAIGALVFAMWIGLDRLATTHAAGGTVAAQGAGHGAGWIAWLVLRVLGAVVTVPAAEELAFRGFVMRRVDSPDFERVDFRHPSLTALLVSSLAFGFMHGARWIAGTLAGLLYALAARQKNRLGEAVGAHACTNALLAVWVICRGEWRLW